jgi:hypothetical protein
MRPLAHPTTARLTERTKHMPRPLSRELLVVALAVASLLGAVIAPGPALGGRLEIPPAAETVLSKTGTPGPWLFPQPPGFPITGCLYPADISSNRSITVQPPVAYPPSGSSSMFVVMQVDVVRRLPNGVFQELQTIFSKAGYATNAAPLSGPAAYYQFPDLGSTVVAIADIEWVNQSQGVVGEVQLLYTQYQTLLEGPPTNRLLEETDACKPAKPASAMLDPTEGIVGSSVHFHIYRFPYNPAVGIYFDGEKIGHVATNEHGNATGNFIVPAVQMGEHAVRFYRYGRSVTKTFAVTPRIKLIPSANLTRGQKVNVSLRGYHAHETVYIRWKKGTTFVQINHVTTSSTGSANIDIHVPSFAVIGTNSVRGDGAYGHAQTNAVTVVASASSTSAVKPSPTPTKTATPKPTATKSPATPTPTATATATAQPTEFIATASPSPSEQAATETATATGTVEPNLTPTIAPTETTMAEPIETATFPTVVIDETPTPGG